MYIFVKGVPSRNDFQDGIGICLVHFLPLYTPQRNTIIPPFHSLEMKSFAIAFAALAAAPSALGFMINTP